MSRDANVILNIQNTYFYSITVVWADETILHDKW